MNISQKDLNALTQNFSTMCGLKTTAMWIYIVLDLKVAEQSMLHAVIY